MEHSGAAMVNVSGPLTAVMGIKIALMALMRLDAVALQLAVLAVSMLHSKNTSPNKCKHKQSAYFLVFMQLLAPPIMHPIEKELNPNNKDIQDPQLIAIRTNLKYTKHPPLNLILQNDLAICMGILEAHAVNE